MLKVFRNKNITKMVLWGILVLTLPAFVMWGSGSLGSSDKKGPAYVGTIENKKISFDNFADSLGSIRCQVILSYYNDPKNMEKILKSKEFLGKLAWDRLIMLAKAKAAGIIVSDKEVVAFIGSHPLFLRGGAFDGRAYEYFLRNSLGLMPRNFEELTRESLRIQKLTDTLTKDMKVSDEEILQAYKKEKDKTFDPEKFKKDKDDYAKKILADKKNAFMEDWLRAREKETTLRIDLKDYEKYYK